MIEILRTGLINKKKKKFKDREKTTGDIISMFFKTLYLWTMAYLICRLVLVIFSFVLPFLVRLFLLYTSCVLCGA